MNLQAEVITGQIFSTLDWIVFFATVVLPFAAVWIGKRRRRAQRQLETTANADIVDYFLMGRRLTLPLFVGTLVASWYGGIFGVTRIAFESGVYNFLTQGVFWYVTYVIFALFLVGRIRSTEAMTFPEIVRGLYGPKTGKLSAVFNFFNMVPVAYAISVGILLQGLFGGELLTNMIFGVGAALTYVVIGGFRDDVYADFVQCIFMCTSVAIVALAAAGSFGGLDFLRANLPATHFSPTGGESWGTTLVWGFIALGTLVDASFYQRCLAAKTPSIARRGILISTVIWAVFDLCTTLGGMYARAVLPNADPNLAYFNMSMQILPSGLRGLVLGGFLATIISTLDSFAFIAGTSISYDLMPEKWRRAKSLHYLSIALVGLVAILLATAFEGSIKTSWKTLGSYYSACMLVPVLIGFIRPQQIRDGIAFTACIMAAVTMTAWQFSAATFGLDWLDPYYVGISTTILILTVGLVVGKPPANDVD